MILACSATAHQLRRLGPWLLSVGLALLGLHVEWGPAGAFSTALAEEPAARPSPSPRARPAPRSPMRSFTNDDLERYRAERPADKPAASPAPSEDGSGSAAEASAPRADEGSSGVSIAARHDELRRALATAEATRDETRTRVERIEQRLNPMSPAFETDPNISLALTAELEAARARLADDEGEVERRRGDLVALEAQARRAGVRLPQRE